MLENYLPKTQIIFFIWYHLHWCNKIRIHTHKHNTMIFQSDYYYEWGFRPVILVLSHYKIHSYFMFSKGSISLVYCRKHNPSACLLWMNSRSVCATKEGSCRTISTMRVPSRSLNIKNADSAKNAAPSKEGDFCGQKTNSTRPRKNLQHSLSKCWKGPSTIWYWICPQWQESFWTYSSENDN